MEAEKEAAMRQVLLVEKNLEFDAPIERVWDAITDPAQIAQWFPDQVAIDDFAVGQRGKFTWNLTDCAGDYEFEIDEVVVHERVVWRWGRDAGTPLEDTVQTSVEWNLSARDGGGTLLHLRETGFATEEDRQGNDSGWDKELAELSDYLAR